MTVTTPCFVLYRQPSEGKAEIIYVGNDKGAAFDAIMSYGNYCQIDELEVVEGNYVQN
jgi:hypothetical protein